MPDLVTHLCAAVIMRRILRVRLFSLFALGVVLPDLLSRPFHIIFPCAYRFLVPMHAPFVSILYCALIALFFARSLRVRVFTLLLAGVFLHFALDVLQNQIAPVYFWLFPFSWKSWWAGAFWPAQAILFLPVTIAVAFLAARCLRRQSSG